MQSLYAVVQCSCSIQSFNAVVQLSLPMQSFNAFFQCSCSMQSFNFNAAIQCSCSMQSSYAVFQCSHSMQSFNAVFKCSNLMQLSNATQSQSNIIPKQVQKHYASVILRGLLLYRKNKHVITASSLSISYNPNVFLVMAFHLQSSKYCCHSLAAIITSANIPDSFSGVRLT